MTTNISARKFSRIALLMIDDQEETPVTMAPMERMRMNGRLSRRTRTAFRKPFWNYFIKKKSEVQKRTENKKIHEENINMNQKQMNEEMEIDLLDLAYMLLDKWHYLLLCLLAGALLFNAYSFFFI